jgi:two-component system, chemotaxis family, CheB/CheR fusion protein
MDQLSDSAAAENADEHHRGTSFPIVGVGASAGGLEAFTQLLQALPADTGMAFVLVQHLAPTHRSALAEILARETKMPVLEVHDEPTIEPNHIYVIPPDRSMIIAGGKLQLLPRANNGAPHPIDQFFRTLAEEQRHQAVGVVLSGTATDGTIGLEAIKAEGGITFAQDATAQHEGMPHSAIASGCVDFVLPPDKIAGELSRIAHHPYAVPEPAASETDDKENLSQVLQLLRHVTGVDFSGYKFNTLYRRVMRRMVFQNISKLAEYVQFLKQTPVEVDALYQDILISVTSFFRDKESFEALKSQVFPRLLKDRSHNDPVRIWTLGCSTGQEAYSLAMAFTEAAEAAGSSATLQLFASDLNTAGIDTARAGVYSKDIAQDVSPERLRRFFSEVDGRYRITREIRDACVFSRHNVLSDPPFSRIDLISCRNLLIYMEPVLQQRIMPTLHYALKPAGCLWLGGAETIGSYRNLFEAEDAKHKIYSKKPGSGPGRAHFPLQHGGVQRSPFTTTARPAEAPDLHREADRVLLTRFAPSLVGTLFELKLSPWREIVSAVGWPVDHF